MSIKEFIKGVSSHDKYSMIMEYEYSKRNATEVSTSSMLHSMAVEFHETQHATSYNLALATIYYECLSAVSPAAR